MRLSDFDYSLPADRIAQQPATPRDSSRLMVLHRADRRIEHRTFSDLPDYLEPGDVLVVNDSRVLPARLHARKASGGAVELLLLQRVAPNAWEALCRPGRRLSPGTELILGDARLTIGERTEAGGRTILFPDGIDDTAFIERHGVVPLPPYIKTETVDPERYQTVYARESGSAAAPTAGLHFTPELLDRVRARGVAVVRVTLHVGLDTFRPIQSEEIASHVMHSEVCEIDPEAAERINGRTGRLIAVGTTSVRTLESMARSDGRIAAGRQATRLFLRPGSEFHAVDGMITNFHLPRTTLLVLVAAFAGRESILEAYQEAVCLGYRFYSFGDAMLIL